MSNVCDAILSDDDDELVQEEEEGSATVVKEEQNSDASEDVDDEEVSDEEEEDEGEEGDEFTTDDPKPVQISEENMTTKQFKELGVCSWITQQLNTMHIKTATPVQAACIPKILEGSDILGCARTGTGKTLAFAIPILQKLSVDPYGIYALILTPTRELAFQIGDQFTAVGKPITLKCSIIVGGRSLIHQARELSERPHIVVATPGRLADLIESDPDVISKVFKKVQFFVLDEADRMLEGQYNDQLKPIFQSLPQKRQTLLLSATITNNINQVHKVSVRKPFFFEDKEKKEESTVDRLEQKFVVCPVAVKDAYLVYVVKNYSEKNPKSSVMIFAQTCRECQALAYMFEGLGFRVGSLHSQIAQKQRLAALSAFRSKTLQVIICTDVASRGLDIPHVDLVVNHNIPQCPKTYIHRVGRSARAGRFGSALSFVTQYDVELLQAVENTIGKKLGELKVNAKHVTKYVTQVLVAKKEAELKLENQKFGERKEINRRKELLMSGMSEEDVDRHLESLKTRRVTNSKRKIDKINGQLDRKTAKKKPKSENYGNVRFGEEIVEPTFNLRLIEAVRHSRCLFDSTDRQYRNTEYKNRVWQRLVTVLNFDGDPRMLSARWKQLRDKYGKEKRKQKYGNEKSSWQYFKHLHFLDPHMIDRADVSPSRKEPVGVSQCVSDPSFAKNLIMQVKLHPCLYDVRDAKYRHGDCRTQAWGMIIEKLHFPGSVPSIYKQWKKHRDRYVREKRRLRTMGETGSDMSTWDLYDDMLWMDQYLDEQQLSRCARSMKRGSNNNGQDGNGPDDMSDYGEYDDDLNYMMMTEKRPQNTDVLLDGDSAFSASIVSDLRTLSDDARVIAKQQIIMLLDTGKISSTPGPTYL